MQKHPDYLLDEVQVKWGVFLYVWAYRRPYSLSCDTHSVVNRSVTKCFSSWKRRDKLGPHIHFRRFWTDLYSAASFFLRSVHCSNHDSGLFSVAVAATDLYSSQPQYASRAPLSPPPACMPFVTFAHERSMPSVTQRSNVINLLSKAAAIWSFEEGINPIDLFGRQTWSPYWESIENTTYYSCMEDDVNIMYR